MPEAVIAEEPVGTPEAVALLDALDAYLTECYPNPEDNFTEFAPSNDDLFLVARIDGRAVGCCGLRLRTVETAEVKRMYVDPSARGHGIGRRLLHAVEATAAARGAQRLVLEFGERQIEAAGLYLSAGFERIPCFDEYAGAPLSTCLGKSL